MDFLGAVSEFFGSEMRIRSPMNPYPIAEKVLGTMLRVAMPHAVRSGAFLVRNLPPRGRQRIIPVPPQKSGHWGLNAVRQLFPCPCSSVQMR